MDPNGYIYMLSEEEQKQLAEDLLKAEPKEREATVRLREDVARLDGYLRARAEVDAPRRRR